MPALLVLRQARRRYRVPRPSTPDHSGGDWEELAGQLEQSPEYQRVLAQLVELSTRFQHTLSGRQHKQWLKLEDALFAHAFFLHGRFFKAGYRLGRVAGGGRQPKASDRPAVELLSVLARVLDLLEK